MKIYRISMMYPREFDGKVIDDGWEVPPDSGLYYEAIRMKDGTIYYGSNHYTIVQRFCLTSPKNRKDIESFGFLGADGEYRIKSNNPLEYMRSKYALSNARIYRMAQYSSILYFGGNKPNPIYRENIDGIFLTPAPDIAQKTGPLVSAYQLQNGEYFIPEIIDPKISKGLKKMYGKNIDLENLIMRLVNHPTQDWISYLNGMGYDGFISGDFIYVFDKKSLKYIGVYDFKNRNVSRI